MNHYVYVAPDMNKTADWYHEVFGMQFGEKNKKETHMWYGDTGGNTCMIIRQSAPGTTAAGDHQNLCLHDRCQLGQESPLRPT